MKRKIPILLMVFLILLIGKAEAVTLIQKIGEGSIKTNVVAGQEVKLKFINNGGTFSGWKVESENVTINSANTDVSFIMPNENVVIKADYILVKYTVSYNANGGSGTISSQTVAKGSAVTLSSTKPTRTGYTFKGWSTSSSATSASYSAGASMTPTGDTTLYAVWSPITYTIAYNKNGGSGTMSSSTHTYDAAKNLTANSFTRSGYTFSGWATSSSGSVVYANKASVKNLSSTSGATVTLYAKWTQTTKTCACSYCSRTITSGTYCSTCSTNCWNCGECSCYCDGWCEDDSDYGGSTGDDYIGGSGMGVYCVECGNPETQCTCR